MRYYTEEDINMIEYNTDNLKLYTFDKYNKIKLLMNLSKNQIRYIRNRIS